MSLKNSKLTPENIQYLRDNINTTRQDILAKKLGFTKNQLKHELSYHKIFRRTKVDEYATPENLEYLKENCNTLHIKTLCNHIGLTDKSYLYKIFIKYNICFLGQTKQSKMPEDGFFHHDPELHTI